MNKLYVAVWIDIIMRGLILVGSLNWLTIAMFDMNFVEWIADRSFYHLDTVVYTLVGISALFYFFARDFYLPFLGRTAYPCGSLTQKVPDNADISVSIKVSPNVNVIFWSAEEGDNVVANPVLAYSEYSNSGVVKADKNGDAILRVRRPASYKVPSITGRTLAPHIHYRTCDSDGMLSRVQTVYVDEKHV